MQRISWWVNEHQGQMNITHHMATHIMFMDHFSVDNVVLPPAVMRIYVVSPKHFWQISIRPRITFVLAVLTLFMLLDYLHRGSYMICLFDLILYVPSTIFQLYKDESSWVEPVQS